ncbi:hypothetical protein R1sor_005161 [Riccia sorocarpa]|uniref:Uncharacterized protein n=1 Tax=Riccia sorocarpa TaxID=122646 RepID=A0ABD3HMK0_9MARC
MGSDLDVLAAQIPKNSEENRRLQQLLAEKTSLMQQAGLLSMAGQAPNQPVIGVKVLHAAHPLDKGKNVVDTSSSATQGKIGGGSTGGANPLTNLTYLVAAGFPRNRRDRRDNGRHDLDADTTVDGVDNPPLVTADYAVLDPASRSTSRGRAADGHVDGVESRH